MFVTIFSITSAVAIGLIIKEYKAKHAIIFFPIAIVYAMICRIYEFHNIFDDFFDGLLSMFVLSWFVHIVKRLIKYPNQLLQSAKTILFYSPLIIIIISYCIGCVIKYYGLDLYCNDNIEVDSYTNKKEYENYLIALDKVFPYDYSKTTAQTIRIYKIPSFNPETMLEILLEENDTTVLKYEIKNKSTWEDRLVVRTDSIGNRTGGHLTGSKKYVPTVTASIQTIDDVSDQEILKKLIQRIDFVTLKSVERQFTNSDNCGYIITLDGIKYVVVIKNGLKTTNYFEFDENTYDDNRYNDIIKAYNKIIGS